MPKVSKSKASHISKSTSHAKKNPILLSKDLPATMEVIYEIKKIVDMEARSNKKRFEAVDKRFEAVDRRFESVDKRFDTLELKMNSRFDSMQADMHKIQADMHKMQADLHRMLVLMEEQNARNKYVLDGHTLLNDRMDRLESNVDRRFLEIEAVVSIKKAEA